MSPNFRNNRPLKNGWLFFLYVQFIGNSLNALHKLFKLTVCGIFAEKHSVPCHQQKQENTNVFDTRRAGGPQCISHQSHVVGTQTHLIPCVSMCPLCRQ